MSEALPSTSLQLLVRQTARNTNLFMTIMCFQLLSALLQWKVAFLRLSIHSAAPVFMLEVLLWCALIENKALLNATSGTKVIPGSRHVHV